MDILIKLLIFTLKDTAPSINIFNLKKDIGNKQTKLPLAFRPAKNSTCNSIKQVTITLKIAGLFLNS